MKYYASEMSQFEDVSNMAFVGRILSFLDIFEILLHFEAITSSEKPFGERYDTLVFFCAFLRQTQVQQVHFERSANSYK